jgi:rubredoxin
MKPILLKELKNYYVDDKHFLCGQCGHIFERSWGKEDSETEAKKLFGEDILNIPCAVVYDNCYNLIIGDCKLQN